MSIQLTSLSHTSAQAFCLLKNNNNKKCIFSKEMRNKLDKCRSWNYFSLLCSSFPSQELFAFKKDVVFSVSSSQKFKLWSKINSINRKPTVTQPASKKERLLNYEYRMRKPFTATHLSYNLAFFRLKNAFYLYL